MPPRHNYPIVQSQHSQSRRTYFYQNNFSTKATKTTILLKLKCANFISLGQLCDNRCTIILNKEQILALNTKSIVLIGLRNKIDGRWDIPIPKQIISTKCCKLPVTHAAIYKTKWRNKLHNKDKILQKKCQHKIPVQLIGELVLDNDFKSAIVQQLKTISQKAHYQNQKPKHNYS